MPMTIELAKGSHKSYEAGMCIMELLAMIRGVAITDNLPCVAASLRSFVIGLNDRATPTARQRLLELIDFDADGKPVGSCLLGTAARGDERQRSFAFADWAVRTVAPLALDAVGRTDSAAILRAVPEIVDAATAEKGRQAAADAADAADASAAYAANAAYDATYAGNAAANAANAANAADAAAYASAAASKERVWQQIFDSAIPLIRRLCE